MYLLERRCGSTLRRVDRPPGITRARWHARGHGSTHSDHTPAFHHRQVPQGASESSRAQSSLDRSSLADIDQRGSLVGSPAPTEPKVTNVTTAAPGRVARGTEEGIS